MELEIYAKNILDDTVASLKDQYAAIPQEVKDVMPKAAVLIAKGAIEGNLSDPDSADLKHANAIMANVAVGGQLALSKLMLDTAANIIAAGLGFIRKIIGI